MFLAQCPIRTRAGPNRLPTLPTLRPATCSVKRPNGRCVSRAWPPCIECTRHCSAPLAAWSALSRPRRPPGVKAERPSPLLSPSHRLSRSDLALARLPEHGRHSRRGQTPLPPPLLLLQSTFATTVYAYVSATDSPSRDPPCARRRRSCRCRQRCPGAALLLHLYYLRFGQLGPGEATAGRSQAPAQPLLAAVGRCPTGRPFPGPPRCAVVRKTGRTSRSNKE